MSGPSIGPEALDGILAMVPTPTRRPPGARFPEVDPDETRRMVRRLIADGCRAIATNGTLGEMATLPRAQWERFVRTVAETVRETAPDFPVFYGATALGTLETLERAAFVRSVGGRGLFLGRPFWCALDADGMLAFYRTVAAEFPDMAILLYDNPAAFKGPIPTEVYGELARLPQVVGAKYIALTPKFDADMAAVGDGLRILPIEVDWLEAWRRTGGRVRGCWASGAACDPAPIVALQRALQAGEEERAERLTRLIRWTYDTFLAFEDFAEFSKYNISMEKIRMDAAGYVRAGPILPPYDLLPARHAEGAREAGRRWRLLAQAVRAGRIPADPGELAAAADG